MKEHDRLYKAAEMAIDELFSDQSVPKSETARSLKSIKDDIELKLSVLGDDE